MKTKSQPSKILQRTTRARLGLAALSLLMVLIAQSAAAQTYRIVYTFTGAADGSPGLNALVRAGNALYGTTGLGGPAGRGTVYKLTLGGQKTVLHSFSGPDGWDPESGLVRDPAGNLYGTTKIGGSVDVCTLTFEGNGCGVIFEISRSGQFTLLHTFTGDDGANPLATLMLDTRGNLYGTTAAGGQNANCGSQLYRDGCGTVFRLTRSSGAWDESVLYSFGGGADSWEPFGKVTPFGGKLFGTTSSGGPPCDSGVCGTVFELTPGGDSWTHKILYPFKGGQDGATPWDGPITDPKGNLYGTTLYGGAFGFGTIFKVDQQGHKSILHSFTGKDGAYPTAALVRDKHGNLFGTATQGGSSKVGTVFQLDPANNFIVLHNFAGGQDGAYPYGTLLLDRATLYGTTVGGGPKNAGVVFEISR